MTKCERCQRILIDHAGKVHFNRAKVGLTRGERLVIVCRCGDEVHTDFRVVV